MSDFAFVAGCLLFALLGFGHLLITIFLDKFQPVDEELLNSLRNAHPKITTEANLWSSMTGFNISHSLGMILFGVVYLGIFLENPRYLEQSYLLNCIAIAFPALFYFLAYRYWYSVPRRVIGLCLFLIVFGIGT